jgi:hypothetical protein
MNSLLYIIAVILVIGWVLGFFLYSTGGIIHILLVIAVIALILGNYKKTYSTLINAHCFVKEEPCAAFTRKQI